MKTIWQCITIVAAASLLAVLLLICLFIHPPYNAPLTRFVRLRLWLQDHVCRG